MLCGLSVKNYGLRIKSPNYLQVDNFLAALHLGVKFLTPRRNAAKVLVIIGEPCYLQL